MTTSLPAGLAGQHLAVVDVEGNGQHPPEIIEIAVLPVDGADTQGEAIRTWLIRPQAPISSFVTRKVHGIANDDVTHCPRWTAVVADVQALLTGRTLVAHSASVEHKVLTAHLPTWRPELVLDTLRLAKHVWPGLDGYGLDVLIECADLGGGGTSERRRHRAGYDAWCAWRLLVVLVEHGDLDWSGLVQVAALPGFGPPEATEGALW